MTGPPPPDADVGGTGSAGGLRARLASLDVLVLAAAVWFLAKFLRYAFPPLFATFRDAYGVTDATLGIAFSVMMLCYAGMQFPSGVLSDRVGPAAVIAGGSLVAAAGALLLGVGAAGAVGLGGLVAAMVLIGLGTGAHKTVAIPLLSRVYDRRGRALGVLDTVGTGGGVAAPALVVALLATGAVEWRLLFLVAGVAGVGLAAVVAVRVPDRLASERRARGAEPGTGDAADEPESGRDRGAAEPTLDPDDTESRNDTDDTESRNDTDGANSGNDTDGTDSPDGADDRSALRTYARPFASPRLLAFVAVTVLFSVTYNGVVAFLPTYLVAETPMSASAAGLTYSGLFVVSVVQPATGTAADRWGTLPVTALTLAVATAGLAGLLLTSAPVVAVAAVLVFGVGSHGFRPVRGSHLVTVAPAAAAGGTLGVVRTALMGAGALAPGTVGVLAASAGYRVAFAALGACLLAAAILSAALVVTGPPRQ